MRVLQYCQHVLGIGHFVRSLEIARALHPHMVVFVEGGNPVQGVSYPNNVEIIRLPPLEMDTEFRGFTVRDDELPAIQEHRKKALLDICRSFRPDVFLIELFPFGRKKFRFELIPAIEFFRATSPDTLIVCSMRDILVEKENQQKYEARVLEVLNKYFDLLLVHSDPRLIKLDDTFSRVKDIAVPLEYTGFVVRKPGGVKGRRKTRRAVGRNLVRIVASNGGGRVGGEVLEMVVRAMDRLGKGYHLDLFPGPFMEREEKKKLLELAKNRPTVSIHKFSKNFVDELRNADISISMAGYNTMMDLVASGTPGLVLPFGQNREQMLRAQKFAERGVVRILKSLDPDTIATEIQNMVNNPPVRDKDADFKMNGAEKTKQILEKYVQAVKRHEASRE